MSTRCQIAIYESGEKHMDEWDVLLYRHSDGYPGDEIGPGVLSDIVPFLRWWKDNRGLGDTEYTGARLLQYLCNQYDNQGKSYEWNKDWDSEHPMGVGELGHGICKAIHGDIAYFYRIYPDAVEVYKVRGSLPTEADLIETVEL